MLGISIIIPVYNVEKYLVQCLESIINQTYKNFEVIIINDGSTDNSEKIIKSYQEKHSCIRYYQQQNQGVSVARNLGLQKANGRYTIFIDPDDYLELNAFELMVNRAEIEDLDVVLIGYTEIYDDNIKGIDTYKFPSVDSEKIYKGLDIMNMMLELQINGFSWDKMFKTSSLKQNNFIFEKDRYIQDWFPVFKQMQVADKVGFINKSLYNYRQRGSSTVHKRNEKYLIDYSHAVSQIIEFSNTNKEILNISSLTKFKIITFDNIIKMYVNFNIYKDKNSVLYKNFDLLDYNCCELSVFQLLVIKDISIKTRCSLMLWKLKARTFFGEMKKVFLD